MMGLRMLLKIIKIVYFIKNKQNKGRIGKHE